MWFCLLNGCHPLSPFHHPLVIPPQWKYVFGDTFEIWNCPFKTTLKISLDIEVASEKFPFPKDYFLIQIFQILTATTLISLPSGIDKHFKNAKLPWRHVFRFQEEPFVTLSFYPQQIRDSRSEIWYDNRSKIPSDSRFKICSSFLKFWGPPLGGEQSQSEMICCCSSVSYRHLRPDLERALPWGLLCRLLG